MSFERGGSQVKVAVIGLGRVGLPFACVLANSIDGKVYGVDKNKQLIENLIKGVLPFEEPGLKEELEKARLASKIHFTTSYREACKESDVFFINVNTPVNSDMRPDLSNLTAALEELCQNIQKNSTIIVRSTLPIGTMEEIVIPLVRRLTKYDVDVLYSPERLLVGNAIRELRELPEIVGCDEKSSVEIYRRIVKSINEKKELLVTDYKTAEAAKLVLNAYRYAKFAISNELVCQMSRFGINAKEVLKIARYKYKRGDMPSPGLVGGPCLFKDSQFLVQKLGSLPIIEAALRVNEELPKRIASDIARISSSLEGKTVGILGVTYKADVDDERNTPVSKLIKSLLEMRVERITIHDPHVKNTSTLEEALKCDIVIIAIGHSEFRDIPLKSFRRGCILYDVWGIFYDKRRDLERLGVDYHFLGEPIKKR